MINCNASVVLSPSISRKFCKITFDSFDIEYDKVQAFLREIGISFSFEYTKIKSENHNPLITSIKNYYYYSHSKVSHCIKPRVEVILSNIFFETSKLQYDDIIRMLGNDSGLILMNIQSFSENFSKIARMLCKINVKELKVCQL